MPAALDPPPISTSTLPKLTSSDLPLSPTEGYPELESEFRETTAEEFLVAWRELHRKQKLRWAAGWATRAKKSGAQASTSRLRGGGHERKHDLDRYLPGIVTIANEVARKLAAASP